MIGGGEFIINGAERVVVSQLHRSPGVDFVVEIEADRQEAARLPGHPRARKLDRAAGHQEGDPGRPHRPVGQVLGDDPAAGDGPASSRPTRRSSRRSTSPRRSTRPTAKAAAQSSRARSPAATSSTRTPARSWSTAARRSPRRSPRCSPTPTSATITVLKDARDPLILQSLQEDPTTDHESGPAADLPAAPAGQPAAAGEGPRAVPREVLRHQPLPPRQGRPVPDQPQVRPGRSPKTR